MEESVIVLGVCCIKASVDVDLCMPWLGVLSELEGISIGPELGVVVSSKEAERPICFPFFGVLFTTLLMTILVFFFSPVPEVGAEVGATALYSVNHLVHSLMI